MSSENKVIKKAIEYFNMFPLQFGKYYIDNELIINETTFNTIKINNDSTVNSVSSFLSKYYTGSNIITYDDYLAYENFLNDNNNQTFQYKSSLLFH